MRSAQLDDCFSKDEQEFLFEIVEAAVGEGYEALAAHEQDIKDRSDAPLKGDMTDLEAADRQKKKLAFLQLLAECLAATS